MIGNWIYMFWKNNILKKLFKKSFDELKDRMESQITYLCRFSNEIIQFGMLGNIVAVFKFCQKRYFYYLFNVKI